MENARALRAVIACLLASSALFAAVPASAATAAATTGVWSAPVRIDDLSAAVFPLAPVAYSDDGSAMAVWLQNDSVTLRVIASVYLPGSGWQSPTIIDAGGIDASYPSVSAGPGGSYVVYFAQLSGWGSNLSGFVNRYAAGSGWSGASKVSNGLATEIFEGEAGTDAAGDIYVAFRDYDGSYYNLYSNYKTSGGSWPSASAEGAVYWQSVSSFHLCVDSGGNATLALVEYDGSYYNLYARRSLSGTFGGAINVESVNTNVPTSFALAPTTDGGAAVAWSWPVNSTYELFVNTYSPTGGWGTAFSLSGGTSTVPGSISLAAGPGGVTYLAYDAIAAAARRPWMSSWNGSGWAAPTDVSGGGLPGTSSSVNAAPHPDGSVTVVWEQYSGTANIRARHFVPAKGWQPIASNFTNAVFSFITLSAGPGPGDTTVAVWAQAEGGGKFRAVSATFAAPDLDAPGLTVTAPADGAHTTVAVAQLTGTTEPGAQVVADGVQAAVGANGSFAVRVALSPGANAILVTATDAAGNVATATVAVNYDDPSVSATTSLSTELNATSARLATAEADLATTEAALAATQAQLSLAQNNASALVAEVSALTLQVQAASVRAATLSDKLNATNATVAQLSAAPSGQAAAGGEAGPTGSLGLILGLLGVVLGAAALALGFVKRGRPAPGESTVRASAPQPPETPKP